MVSINDTVRFIVTEEHLRLAQQMYVSWGSCAFGAPAIDCKRPYGNSAVYEDIAVLIGIPLPDREEDEEFSDLAIQRMDKLHKEMQTVLQIGLRTLKFEVGEYVCHQFFGDWIKVQDDQ